MCKILPGAVIITTKFAWFLAVRLSSVIYARFTHTLRKLYGAALFSGELLFMSFIAYGWEYLEPDISITCLQVALLE